MPLAQDHPETLPAIAEGAIMRLLCGEQCFEAYRAILWAGARLLREPQLIETAKAELDERRGADFTYEAMVGDRAPPLDYRKSAKGGD